MPSVRKGDNIGHELTGEVVEAWPSVTKFRGGDRVVMASVIGCGECVDCTSGARALCDNSNPNAALQESMHGVVTAGVFGFSHAFGGYPGSHAELIRVPFADHGAFYNPRGNGS